MGAKSELKHASPSSRESAQDDAESAAITLVANVATQWFTIQYYNDRKELTQKLLALSEDYYELVESYYVAGQTTGMDVLEQRQQIETLRSTLNEIDANIRIAKHALSIMAGGQHVPQVAGKLPEAIDVGGTPTIEALLEARPDVRSALRNAQAADAKITIALANRHPSLRISAGLSYRDNSLIEMLAKRMRISRELGQYKREHDMTVVQTTRYNEILDKRGAQGVLCGMSADFIKAVFEAVHEESVRQQIEIMNKN